MAIIFCKATPVCHFSRRSKPTPMHETNTARKLRHTSKRQPFRITYPLELLKVCVEVAAVRSRTQQEARSRPEQEARSR